VNAPAPSAEGVQLLAVSKAYGSFLAVDDIDLAIPRGSYFCLLGPSGSGKSTVLRMIAGLETPTHGRVVIGDRDVSATPANRRPVHTVFQSYALFPRMSVFDNVAYGLRAQGRPSRAEVSRRVSDALAQVRLAGSERKKPAALSGGQQQRVALARALVNRPEVLLLDEPLGALDLQLRREMQDELVRLHRDSGTTFVHVTHDQEECFACATQVAVMRAGKVEQIGAPRDVYRQPRSRFVAGFLGTANIVPADVVATEGDQHRVRVAGGELLSGGRPALRPGGTASLVVRPEDIDIASADRVGTDGWLRATLIDQQATATVVRVRLRLESGTELTAERSASPSAALQESAGDAIAVRFDREPGWLIEDDPPTADG
jgi:spermidine/putrescine transport system ATP-binding protein